MAMFTLDRSLPASADFSGRVELASLSWLKVTEPDSTGSGTADWHRVAGLEAAGSSSNTLSR